MFDVGGQRSERKEMDPFFGTAWTRLSIRRPNSGFGDRTAALQCVQHRSRQLCQDSGSRQSRGPNRHPSSKGVLPRHPHEECCLEGTYGTILAVRLCSFSCIS